jgi:large subunit ribosomal protein L9
MEVILTQPIRRLGSIGDVVEVKNGFARNYLIPYSKAVRATEEAKKDLEKQKKKFEEQNNQAKKEAEAIAGSVENLYIFAIRQAGKDGRLYGSVSAKDIASLVSEKIEANINYSNVIIESPIKKLGIYNITLTLHPEVSSKIKVCVARSEVEAIEAQKADKQADSENESESSEQPAG